MKEKRRGLLGWGGCAPRNEVGRQYYHIKRMPGGKMGQKRLKKKGDGGG